MSSGLPPILMYHGIIDVEKNFPEDREPGASLYDLPLAVFRQHLEFLKKNNFQVNTCDSDKKKNGGKQVVLTFDDGEMNNFLHVFPMLQQYDFPAYFFITVDRIGKKGYMDWPHLKVMIQNNLIIGSHGMRHEILTKLNEAELVQELRLSRKILEDRLQKNIFSFSVPRGFFNLRILKLAKEAGYSEIFVSGCPQNLPDECWGRIAVKSRWGTDRLAMALEGRIPLNEKIFEAVKNTIQSCIGDENYDRWRDKILMKS